MGYTAEELPAEGQFSSILPFHCCCSITSDVVSLSEERTRMQRGQGLCLAHLPPLHLFLHRISDFPYTLLSSKSLLHVFSLLGSPHFSASPSSPTTDCGFLQVSQLCPSTCFPLPCLLFALILAALHYHFTLPSGN